MSRSEGRLPINYHLAVEILPATASSLAADRLRRGYQLFMGACLEPKLVSYVARMSGELLGGFRLHESEGRSRGAPEFN